MMLSPMAALKRPDAVRGILVRAEMSWMILEISSAVKWTGVLWT